MSAMSADWGNFNMKKNKGFTLIELLVVIAVIGILASVVMASLNSARMKARDAKRKADMKQIQIALELYYDQVGKYTVYEDLCSDSSIGSNNGACSGAMVLGTGWAANSDLGEIVAAGFMPSLPLDPKNTLTNYYWYEPSNPAEVMNGKTDTSSTGGILYTLCTYLETTGGTVYCVYS